MTLCQGKFWQIGGTSRGSDSSFSGGNTAAIFRSQFSVGCHGGGFDHSLENPETRGQMANATKIIALIANTVILFTIC